MIIYTDKVKGGIKVKMLPLIMINPKYKGDKGLVAHEMEHVKQYLYWFIPLFAITLGLSNWLAALLVSCMAHDLLYTLSSKYRQWSEVKAFKAQLKHGGRVEDAAKLLSENYKLDITYEKALRLFK
jgi:hypothetical protein